MSRMKFLFVNLFFVVLSVFLVQCGNLPLPTGGSNTDTDLTHDYKVVSSSFAQDIALDFLGNVYIAGWLYNSNSRSNDLLVIKYDREGNVVWERVYDSGEGDHAFSIATDREGNVYVTGGSSGDFLTIKYDSEGNILWMVTYDSDYFDEGRGVAVDSDDSVYVIGFSKNDFLIIKYSSQKGDILWKKTFDAGGYDYPYGIAVAGEEIYIVGRSGYGSYEGENYVVRYDFRIIKCNFVGELLWSMVYDKGQDEIAKSIAIDMSGNFYVTGYRESRTKDPDFLTVKFDDLGNIIWEKIYDSSDETYHRYDYAYDIALDPEGNSYITGWSNNNFATIKYDSEGNTIWEEIYNSGENDVPTAIVVDNSGIYVTGYSKVSSYLSRTIKYVAQDSIPKRILWNVVRNKID